MLAPRDNHLDEAWGIALRLHHGRLTLDDVARQVADAAEPALQARVAALLQQVTTHEEQGNEARLRAAFTAHAEGANGRLDFARFRELLGRELAGIVFTAHPTFSLSIKANERALELVRAGTDGLHADASAAGPAQSAPLRRRAAPTLEEELDSSTAAIRNLRRAIRRALRVAVDVAAELYPREYADLGPCIVTVATWVGFDLDGRTDIGWSRSLSCRYRLALAGIEELGVGLAVLRTRHTESAAGAAFDDIESALAVLGECFKIGLDALGREAEDTTRLGRLNRLALEKRALKQDARGTIDAALATLLTPASGVSDELRRDVVVFRAEWESNGTALARLHFRLNSVQLHNAIRPDIALHAAPGESASRRYYLAAVTRLLDSVVPVNVHYGTVAREQTTAKRVFMLAAQFRKHFDERTPIRVLIAESDTPFTLLAALYYARLFGVEQHVEISPLFETAEGLHHGDRVISELLDNPHFASYVRTHGRFCVQLGFSDSGRYVGQLAATLAIERFKLRLIRLWHARGLTATQLVFFDTHGESIGRGSHPRSLADRFLYTHSSEVRRHLAELAAPYKHEVSFQGGEGYLWFAAERTAFAVLTDLVCARLGRTEQAADELYVQSGWSLDFFLTLKNYQETLAKHPGYLALINTPGLNLLLPTGSRALQRQSAGHGIARVESVADLRAIPNNAILHQLAYLANSFAGLGHASNQAPETFLAVLDGSERLARLLALALTARARSDITMLEAYAELMNASYWLDRTSQSLDRDLNRVLRRISSALESTFDYDAMARFVRGLRCDAAELDDVLERRTVTGAWSSADALTRLHTLRLALIQLIYIKAMEIPQFSSRLEVSLATLIERLLHLDVPGTVATLRRIFPAAPPSDDSEVYAERDTYAGTGPAGYAAEHARIFDPLERAHALILELSALIALYVGAYG